MSEAKGQDHPPSEDPQREDPPSEDPQGAWEARAGRLFDGWAESGRGERMAAGHERLAARAIRALELDSSSRLIDLGCGVGRALEAAHAQSGCALAGVDASAAMIARAQERLPDAELYAAPVSALPFAAGSFTHALSVEAIYYFEDPLQALRELRRVLEPGAPVALALELFRENEGSQAWIEALSIPVHLLSADAWCERLAAAGFQGARHERIHCHDQHTWSGPSAYFPSRELFAKYVEGGALLLLAEA